MPGWLRRNNNSNKKLSMLRPLWSRAMDRLDRLKQHMRSNVNKPDEHNESDKPSLSYWNYAFNKPLRAYDRNVHECYIHSYRQCDCSGKCADLDDDYAGFSGAPEGGVYREAIIVIGGQERREKRNFYEQLKRDRIAARIKAKRRAERRKEIRV